MDSPLRIRKKRRGHKGSVLVLVLIVMSTMIILSVGLAYRTRIEMRLAYTNAQRMQAYYLALGGIERIKALLSREKLEPSTITRICQFTGKATEEELFEQFVEFAQDERKWLTYCLRDELGCLSLNKSDPASWENLDCISRELQAAILDWIDKDNETTSDGAEMDFYQRIEPPYACKNSDCITLKELLFLRGLSREVYLGEDLNRDSILDENERDGRLKMPPDNEDVRLDLGFVDVFTIFGD
ncbi:MAG: type II secretion system minor pseudopilin, partial [Planctomycetota bacterium]